MSDGTTVVDSNGNIDAPVTTTNLTTTGNTTIGDAAGDTLDINATISDDVLVGTTKKIQFRDTGLYINSGADGKLTISADGSGTDDITLSGTVVVGDAQQNNGTIIVGVDDTGYDVKFFGATASAFALWDESEDALKLSGVARLDLSSCTVNASNTDGGVIKAGTSGAPVTEDTANMKFVSMYFDDGATSGTSVGLYDRLYVTGVGGSGQALRAFGTVSDVAAGNIYGAHISASFGTTGSITGLGNALATTLHIPGAMTNGTYAVQTVELWADAATSNLAGTTAKSFMRVGAGGDGTGVALLDDSINLFDFYGITAGSGNMIDTDKTALTGKAGIKVSVAGALYGYIPIVTGS